MISTDRRWLNRYAIHRVERYGKSDPRPFHIDRINAWKSYESFLWLKCDAEPQSRNYFGHYSLAIRTISSSLPSHDTLCGTIIMAVIWTNALSWSQWWRIYCMLALLPSYAYWASYVAYVLVAVNVACFRHRHWTTALMFRSIRSRAVQASAQLSLLDLLPFPSKIIYKSRIIYTLVDRIAFNLL